MGSTPVQLAPGDRRSRERLNLGERLTQLVSERARALGIEIFETDVRDVMLPGDLKAAFGDVPRRGPRDARRSSEPGASPRHSATWRTQRA